MVRYISSFLAHLLSAVLHVMRHSLPLLTAKPSSSCPPWPASSTVYMGTPPTTISPVETSERSRSLETLAPRSAAEPSASRPLPDETGEELTCASRRGCVPGARREAAAQPSGAVRRAHGRGPRALRGRAHDDLLGDAHHVLELGVVLARVRVELVPAGRAVDGPALAHVRERLELAAQPGGGGLDLEDVAGEGELGHEREHGRRESRREHAPAASRRARARDARRACERMGERAVRAARRSGSAHRPASANTDGGTRDVTAGARRAASIGRWCTSAAARTGTTASVIALVMMTIVRSRDDRVGDDRTMEGGRERKGRLQKAPGVAGRGSHQHFAKFAVQTGRPALAGRSKHSAGSGSDQRCSARLSREPCPCALFVGLGTLYHAVGHGATDSV